MWYQALDLEFGAFGAENFTKVTFLMDDSFKNVMKDNLYQCIFIEPGAYHTCVTSISPS